ncbi:MAG: YraN family protein [Ignavibacteria bacterium]|jgi:putative endonuclease|nr:YraN family protein [Ignavibacteria bacterium]MCU7504167.1 YraN family protein [Ignavibacteria bacterium]MCU7516383.1 YraN family protein [Ignavibacteria bacterium]
MSLESNKAGREGEEMAARLLESKGFRIVERNYHFGKGEIDIIAKDGETLVFVEVKYRQNLEYGEPEYSITPAKIKQVRKLAECYLFERKIDESACRFDVVAILEERPGEPVINYYEDAF